MKMTEFEKQIIDVLKRRPMRMGSTWEIAMDLHQKEWYEKRRSHAGWITQIDKTGQRIGLIRIPPKNEYDCPTLCLPEEYGGE